MDQLPQEIVEMIFGHLPLPDLCKSYVFVCKQWRDVIMRKEFMKWQKVYYKYRSGDTAASTFLRETSLRAGMTDVETCFKNFVTYVTSSFSIAPQDCSSTLRCLQSHRHYDLAVQILRENYDFSSDQNHQPLWSIVAVICLLSSDAWSYFDLLKILASPGSAYTSLEITEKIYCILSLFLYFGNVFKVSTRWHYNLFQALHWIENNSEEEQLTEEQLKIVNHDLKLNEIVKVVAYAGTGKTTTMVHFTMKNPETRVLLTMYNKAAIDDAKDKFPDNVTCRTMHSLAYKHVVQSRYKTKLIGTIFTSTLASSRVLGDRRGFQRYRHKNLVLETLNRYMASADRDIVMHHAPTSFVVVDTNTGVEQGGQLLTHDQRKVLVADARTVWNAIRDPSKKELPLPHDAYLKIWQLENPNLFELERVDCIIVDEAQDMSAAMLDIVLGHSGSRIIVGDPHQQVYQWRYAINALDRVTPTHTYYLTNSFRFGPEVGYLANSCLSFFKGVSKNILVGSKIQDSLGREVTDSNPHNGQVCYIARTNLELFKKVIEVISPYMPSATPTSPKPPIKIAFVGGADNMGFDNVLNLYYLLKGDRWNAGKFLKRFENLTRFEDFVKDSGDKEWAAKIAIVKHSGARTKEYIETIRNLEVDMDEADVVFTTAHKSKGLEWDTVVLLDDFVPSLTSYRDRADVQHGEPNLLYVAVTRAKSRLIINPACYYVLLFAGHRQEEVVPTEDQYLTYTVCSSCHQELPGQFGRRSVSLATLPLQVMTKTGSTIAFRPGLLCSGCAGLPWYTIHRFESYRTASLLQTKLIKEDMNHRALQFLAGPKEAEKEVNSFYWQRKEGMIANENAVLQ